MNPAKVAQAQQAMAGANQSQVAIQQAIGRAAQRLAQVGWRQMDAVERRIIQDVVANRLPASALNQISEASRQAAINYYRTIVTNPAGTQAARASALNVQRILTLLGQRGTGPGGFPTSE
jgi:hypothetical protein